LSFEVERLRDNQEHERENLALRLENLLLRERGLSPAGIEAEPVSEGTLSEIEGLRRENTELRQRLEQREQ